MGNLQMSGAKDTMNISKRNLKSRSHQISINLKITKSNFNKNSVTKKLESHTNYSNFLKISEIFVNFVILNCVLYSEFSIIDKNCPNWPKFDLWTPIFRKKKFKNSCIQMKEPYPMMT